MKAINSHLCYTTAISCRIGQEMLPEKHTAIKSSCSSSLWCPTYLLTTDRMMGPPGGEGSLARRPRREDWDGSFREAGSRKRKNNPPTDWLTNECFWHRNLIICEIITGKWEWGKTRTCGGKVCVQCIYTLIACVHVYCSHFRADLSTGEETFLLLQSDSVITYPDKPNSRLSQILRSENAPFYY